MMCLYDKSKFETLTIDKEDFGDDSYKVLGEALKILIKAGYECQVVEEEVGLIVINYNYAPYKAYGNPHLVWLSEEEEEVLNSYDDFIEDSKTEEDIDMEVKFHSLSDILKEYKSSIDEIPPVVLDARDL